MRFLVTGSTGFIGRRLMAHLTERFPGAPVTCLVKAPVNPQEAAALAGFERAGIRLIPGDLALSPISAAEPPDVDVVLHLAANIDTSASEEDSHVNDTGTGRLFDWLGPRQRGTRVVFTSTVAVCDLVGDGAGPVDETSRCAPRTAYGRSKLAAEDVVRRRAAADAFTYTMLRLPTVYGAGQKPGGMFDLLMRSAERNTLVARVNWPGKTSVVYIEDVARLILDVAQLPAAANETICVATDETLSVGEIARTLGALTGHPVRPIDFPPVVWKVARLITRNEWIGRVLPKAAQQSYWRLSLVVDDGFLQSGRKMRALVPTTLSPLPEGVRAMLDALSRGAGHGPS
jgi:UDP-glucose 4-epimerase